MKTEDAIEIIDGMIDDQEEFEDAVLADDPENEEMLHEIEVDLEALRMAKRALEAYSGKVNT